MLTVERLAERWHQFRANGERMRDPQESVWELERYYVHLVPADQRTANREFARWILEGDATDRHAALAMISRFSITETLPQLRLALDHLDRSAHRDDAIQRDLRKWIDEIASRLSSDESR